MQLTTDAETKSVGQKLKTITGILAWAAGLLLAGSDGPLMPFLNLGGVALFACASLWLAGQARKAGDRPAVPAAMAAGATPPAGQKRSRPRTGAGTVPVWARECGGIRPRYARELGAVHS